VSWKLAGKNKSISDNSLQAIDSCRQRQIHWHLGSWIHQVIASPRKTPNEGTKVTAASHSYNLARNENVCIVWNDPKSQ
jgi:hypothetical protein